MPPYCKIHKEWHSYMPITGKYECKVCFAAETIRLQCRRRWIEELWMFTLDASKDMLLNHKPVFSLHGNISVGSGMKNNKRVLIDVGPI